MELSCIMENIKT